MRESSRNDVRIVVEFGANCLRIMWRFAMNCVRIMQQNCRNHAGMFRESCANEWRKLQQKRRRSCVNRQRKSRENCVDDLPKLVVILDETKGDFEKFKWQYAVKTRRIVIGSPRNTQRIHAGFLEYLP